MAGRTDGVGDECGATVQTLPRSKFRSAAPKLRPFRSVHPGQLPDGTMDYSQLQLSPTVHQRSGHVSPLRAVRTIREYDQQIENLQKENFNLKLRLYFLEQSIDKKFDKDSRDHLKVNVQLKIESETLQKDLGQKTQLLQDALDLIEKQEEKHKEALDKAKQVQLELEEKVKTLQQEVESLTNTPRSSDGNSEYYKEAFGLDEGPAGGPSCAPDKPVEEVKLQFKVDMEKLQSEVEAKDKEIEKMRDDILSLENKNKLHEEKIRKRNIAIQGMYQMLHREQSEPPKETLYESLASAIEAANSGNQEGVLSMMNVIITSLKELFPSPDSRLSVCLSSEHTDLNSEVLRRDEVIKALEKQLLDQAQRSSGKTENIFSNNIALEKECGRLQKVVREKDLLIQELLNERTSIASEQAAVESLSPKWVNKDQDEQFDSVKRKSIALEDSESIKMMQESISEKNAEIDRHKNAIDLLDTQLGEYRCQLQEAIDDARDKEEKLSDISNHAQNLEKQLAALQLEFEKLKSSHNSQLSNLTNESLKASDEQHTVPKLNNEEVIEYQLINFDESSKADRTRVSDKHTSVTDFHDHHSIASSLSMSSERPLDEDACVSALCSAVVLPDNVNEVSKTIFLDESGKDRVSVCVEVKVKEKEIDSETMFQMMKNDIESSRLSKDNQNVSSSLESQSQNLMNFGQSSSVADLKEEIWYLILMVEQRDKEIQINIQKIADLEKQIESLSSQNQSYGNDVLVLHKRLNQSQEYSGILLKRLVELSKFMQSMLKYDETGKLDASSLTPEGMIRFMKFLDDSTELSQNLSQNLTMCEESRIFDLEEFSDKTFDDSSFIQTRDFKSRLPSLRESWSFMDNDLEGRESRLIRRQEQHVFRAGKRRRWSYSLQHEPAAEHEVEPTAIDQLVCFSDNEDILLLLNEQSVPENVPLKSGVKDFHESLMDPKVGVLPNAAVCRCNAIDSSDTVNNSDFSEYVYDQNLCWNTEPQNVHNPLPEWLPQNEAARVVPLVPNNKEGSFRGIHCISSDSDIWSEPDRNISLQRIGIEVKVPMFHHKSPSRKHRFNKDAFESSDYSSEKSSLMHCGPKGKLFRRRCNSGSLIKHVTTTGKAYEAMIENHLRSLGQSMEDKLSYLLEIFHNVQAGISELSELKNQSTASPEVLENISDGIKDLQSTLSDAVDDVKILKEKSKSSPSIQDSKQVQDLQSYFDNVIDKITDADQLKQMLAKELHAKESAERILQQCDKELSTFKKQLREMKSTSLSNSVYRQLMYDKQESISKSNLQDENHGNFENLPHDIELLYTFLAEEMDLNSIINKKLNQLQNENLKLKTECEQLQSLLGDESESLKQLKKTKALDDKIAALISDIERLENSVASEMDQNMDLKKKINELTIESQILKSENEQMQIDLKSKNIQLESISKAEPEGNESLRKSVKEKLTAESKFTDLYSNIEQLKSSLSNEERETSSLNRRVSELLSENRKLSRDLEQLNIQFNSQIDHMEVINKEKNDFHKQNLTLSIENTDFKKQLQYQEERVEQLMVEKSEISGKLLEGSRQMIKLNDQIQKLEDQKELLEKEIKQHVSDFSSMELLCDELKHDVKYTKERLKILDLQCKKCENDLEKVLVANDKLSAEKRTLEEDVETKGKKLVELNQINCDIKKQVKDLKSNNMDIERGKSLLVDELENLKAKHLQTSSSHEKVASENKNLGKKLSSLEAQLKTSHSTLQNNKEEQEHLQLQLTNMQNKVKRKESALKDLEEQRDALQEQLKDQQHNLKKHAIDIKHLEEENCSLQQQLHNLQKKSERNSNELELKDSKMDILTDHIFDLKQQIKDHEIALKIMEEEKKQTEYQILTLETEIQKQDALKQQLKVQAEKYEGNISDLQRQLSSRDILKKQIEAEKLSLVSIIDEKDESMKKMENNSKKMDEKLTTLQSNVFDLQLQIQRSEAAKKLAEEGFESICREMSRLKADIANRDSIKGSGSSDHLAVMEKQLKDKELYCKTLETEIDSYYEKIMDLQKEARKGILFADQPSPKSSAESKQKLELSAIFPKEISNKVESIEIIIEKLRNDIQTSVDVIQNLQLNNRDLEKEVGTLSEKLTDSENLKDEQMTDILKEIGSYADQVKILETSVDQKGIIIKNMNQELFKARNLILEKQRSIDHLGFEVAKYKRLLKTLHHDKDQMDAQISIPKVNIVSENEMRETTEVKKENLFLKKQISELLFLLDGKQSHFSVPSSILGSLPEVRSASLPQLTHDGSPRIDVVKLQDERDYFKNLVSELQTELQINASYSHESVSSVFTKADFQEIQNENQTLKKQVQQLQKENLEFKKQVQDWIADKKSYTKKIIADDVQSEFLLNTYQTEQSSVHSNAEFNELQKENEILKKQAQYIQRENLKKQVHNEQTEEKAPTKPLMADSSQNELPLNTFQSNLQDSYFKLNSDFDELQNENRNLQIQVQDLQKENLSCKKQIQDMHNKLRDLIDLQKENPILERKIQYLQNKNLNLQKQVQSWLNEKKMQAKKLVDNDLQSELQLNTFQSNEHDFAIHSNSEFDELQKESHTLKNQVQYLQNENFNLKKQFLGKLSEKKTPMETVVFDDLQNEFPLNTIESSEQDSYIHSNSDFHDLQSENLDLQMQVQDLQEKNLSYEKQVQDMHEKLSNFVELQTESPILKKKLQYLQNENLNLKKEVQSLLNEQKNRTQKMPVEDLQNVLPLSTLQSNSEFGELQNENSVLKKRVQYLQKETLILKKQVQCELSKNKTEAKTVISDDLQNDLPINTFESNQQEHFVHSQSDFDGLQNENLDLQMHVQDLQEENHDLGKQVQDMHDKHLDFVELQTENPILKKKVQYLQNENLNLKRQVQSLSEQKTDAQKAIGKDLQSEFPLSAYSSNEQDSVIHSNSEFDELQKENHIIKRKVQYLQKETFDLKKQIQDKLSERKTAMAEDLKAKLPLNPFESNEQAFFTHSNSDFEDLQNENLNLHIQMQDLQDENLNFVKQVQDMHVKLSSFVEVQNENQILKKKVKCLQKENLNLKQQAQVWLSEKNTYMKKVITEDIQNELPLHTFQPNEQDSSIHSNLEFNELQKENLMLKKHVKFLQKENINFKKQVQSRLPEKRTPPKTVIAESLQKDLPLDTFESDEQDSYVFSNSDYDDLQSENLDLQMQVQDLQEENLGYKEQVKNLQEGNHSFKKQVQDMNDKLLGFIDMQKEIPIIKKKMQHLQKENFSLKKEAQLLLSEKKTYAKKMTDLQSDVPLHVSQSNDKASSISSKSEFYELQSENLLIKKQVRYLQKENFNLKRQVEGKISEGAHPMTVITEDLPKELPLNAFQLDEQDSYIYCNSDYDDLQNENLDLQIQVQDLQNENFILKKQVQDMHDRLLNFDSLQEENDSLRKELQVRLSEKKPEKNISQKSAVADDLQIELPLNVLQSHKPTSSYPDSDFAALQKENFKLKMQMKYAQGKPSEKKPSKAVKIGNLQNELQLNAIQSLEPVSSRYSDSDIADLQKENRNLKKQLEDKKGRILEKKLLPKTAMSDGFQNENKFSTHHSPKPVRCSYPDSDFVDLQKENRNLKKQMQDMQSRLPGKKQTSKTAVIKDLQNELPLKAFQSREPVSSSGHSDSDISDLQKENIKLKMQMKYMQGRLPERKPSQRTVMINDLQNELLLNSFQSCKQMSSSYSDSDLSDIQNENLDLKKQLQDMQGKLTGKKRSKSIIAKGTSLYGATLDGSKQFERTTTTPQMGSKLQHLQQQQLYSNAEAEDHPAYYNVVKDTSKSVAYLDKSNDDTVSLDGRIEELETSLEDARMENYQLHESIRNFLQTFGIQNNVLVCKGCGKTASINFSQLPSSEKSNSEFASLYEYAEKTVFYPEENIQKLNECKWNLQNDILDLQKNLFPSNSASFQKQKVFNSHIAKMTSPVSSGGPTKVSSEPAFLYSSSDQFSKYIKKSELLWKKCLLYVQLDIECLQNYRSFLKHYVIGLMRELQVKKNGSHEHLRSKGREENTLSYQDAHSDIEEHKLIEASSSDGVFKVPQISTSLNPVFVSSAAITLEEGPLSFDSNQASSSAPFLVGDGLTDSEKSFVMKELKQKTEDIVRLKSKVNELTEEVEALQQENKELQKQGRQAYAEYRKSHKSKSSLLDSNREKQIENDDLRLQLRQAENASKSLTVELDALKQMYEEVGVSKVSESDALSRSKSVVLKLLREIKSLRLEMESVGKENNLLRKRLLHAALKTSTSKSSARVLSNEGDTSSDKESMLSTDATVTLSRSASVSQTSIDSLPKLQDQSKIVEESVSPEEQKPAVQVLPSIMPSTEMPETFADSAFQRSHFSSPDLGIESDPNHEIQATECNRMYEVSEPGHKSICQSVSSAIGGSSETSLHAIAFLQDYELLKKEVDECLVGIKSIHSRATDGLKHFSTNGTPSKNLGYSTLKEILNCCSDIEVCQQETKRLVSKFWVSSFPIVDDKGFIGALIMQNQELCWRLSTIKERMKKQAIETKEATGRLKAARKQKDALEKAVFKELGKTNKCLELAKTNLCEKERKTKLLLRFSNRKVDITFPNTEPSLR